jgi:hypothetical protein
MAGGHGGAMSSDVTDMKQTPITDYSCGQLSPMKAMKTCCLLFGGLAWVLATGCSHQRENPPASAAIVPSLTESGEVTVPLPAQTPFDGKPNARAAYLESYAMGYRLAATDYASPGCLCGSEGDAECYEATVSGFFAGKEAGSAAFANNRRQNQAPFTATSGTPTATPPSRQR